MPGKEPTPEELAELARLREKLEREGKLKPLNQGGKHRK